MDRNKRRIFLVMSAVVAVGALSMLYYVNRVQDSIVKIRDTDQQTQTAEETLQAFRVARDDAQAKSLLEQYKTLARFSQDERTKASAFRKQIQQALKELGAGTDMPRRMHRIGVIKQYLGVLGRMIPTLGDPSQAPGIVGRKHGRTFRNESEFQNDERYRKETCTGTEQLVVSEMSYNKIVGNPWTRTPVNMSEQSFWIMMTKSIRPQLRLASPEVNMSTAELAQYWQDYKKHPFQERQLWGPPEITLSQNLYQWLYKMVQTGVSEVRCVSLGNDCDRKVAATLAKGFMANNLEGEGEIIVRSQAIFPQMAVWEQDHPWTYLEDGAQPFLLQVIEYKDTIDGKDFVNKKYVITFQSNELEVLFTLRWVLESLQQMSKPLRDAIENCETVTETSIQTFQKMVDHYFEARDYLVRTVGKGSPWYEQHKVDDLIAEWDRFTSAPNLALNFVAQLTGMKLFTDRFLKF